MRDSTLFFRNTTASLTATETSAGIVINGTPAGGLALFVDIPKQSAGDQIDGKLHHSTDGSTWADLLTFRVASTTAASTKSIRVNRRFHTRLARVRLELTVAGTSPDYGAVIAGIGDSDQWNVLAVGQNATIGDREASG